MLKAVVSTARRLLGFRASYKMLWAKDHLGRTPVEHTVNISVEAAFAEVLDIIHWLTLNLQKENSASYRRVHIGGAASLLNAYLYTSPEYSEMKLIDQLTSFGYGSAAIAAAVFTIFACRRVFSDRKQIKQLSRWQRSKQYVRP